MTTTTLISLESSYENINLNEVFNFTYNLNVFKQVIEAIARNQKSQTFIFDKKIFDLDSKVHDTISNFDFKFDGYLTCLI